MRPIAVSDRVYGPFTISDPAALELLAHPAVARLEGVNQGGYTDPFFPGPFHSRLEHSLGVYRLLDMFGAGREERIAGLLHDISHTVFSHCADYALDAGSESKQSYQDDVFRDYAREMDIEKVVAAHGLDVESVLEIHGHGLLERELPELCADRIDYALRTAVLFGEASLSRAVLFLDKLTVRDGKFVFKEFEAARDFGLLFMRLNTAYYAGLPSAAMFRSVGDVLRRCLKKGYLEREELFSRDEAVLARIRGHLGGDEELARLYRRMTGESPAVEDPEGSAEVWIKSRAVDPPFVGADGLTSVAQADPGYLALFEGALRPRRYTLRFSDSKEAE